MRLLSRVLAGSVARAGVSGSPERCAEHPAPVLDDGLRDLLRRYVNSPIKLDLLLYLHGNPYALDGTDRLALRLGREAPLVEECAAELARDGLLSLVAGKPAEPAAVYRLTSDPVLSGRVARLAMLHARGGASRIRSAIRDIGIAEATRMAIGGSTRLSCRTIEVGCASGTVSLEGSVNTSAERAELELICERLRESRHGVRVVENRVVVDARALPEDGETQDAVARLLDAHMQPPGGVDVTGGRMRVGVEVIGGVAYLTGLVATPQDRVRAAQLAGEAAGVADVVNWVDVQGQRSR